MTNQVAHLERRRRSLVAEIVDLSATHEQERQRADEAETQLAAARFELEQRRDPSIGDHHFGHRMEKLIYVAEHEAAAIRENA